MGARFNASHGPVDTTERLGRLRTLLKEKSLDAYVVYTQDSHASEYIADVDKRREFISGFTGSAGTAIITQDKANLFTDGRYFLQAENQLDKNWTLMKMGTKGVPTISKYLSSLPQGSKIGTDPAYILATDAESVQKELDSDVEDRKDKATPDLASKLVPVEENLIDKLWGSNQPAPPHNPVKLHELKYAGKDTKSKIKDLQEYLVKNESHAFVVTALEEIAWLFNLRGSDIIYNPVFFAYAIVTQTQVTIFVEESKLTTDANNHLKESNVQVASYESFFTTLAKHSEELREKIKNSNDTVKSSTDELKDKIVLGTRASWAVTRTIGEGKFKVTRSPVGKSLSAKNETEIQGFRNCHIRDGAALISYFAWLEEQLLSGARLTEYEGSQKLEQFRAKQELFVGPSFDTISSTGPNAAIIHYSPDPNDSAVIDPENIYLCDSGGQYHDGTTDVTRTLHFKTPTPEQREAFTLVLKGVIAIDSVVFPSNVSGYRIDVLARMALWKHGLDYRHGTGHGVGSYLNVHEGVHGIGPRKEYDNTNLEIGMTISDEPGYYKDGHWGIRIENVVAVQEAKTPYKFGDVDYYKLENLTMCPINLNLISPDLLSTEEINWLNSYHTKVVEKVTPILTKLDDQRALAWLKRQTVHINKV